MTVHMSPTEIRDISVAVYKRRLGKRSADRMLAADGDDGTKLRERAGSYDPLTRAYIEILGVAAMTPGIQMTVTDSACGDPSREPK